MPDWYFGGGNWTENSPTRERFIGAALTFTIAVGGSMLWER